MPEEKVHSLYSPSGYKWLKYCPGYVGDKKSKVHPVTLEGTAIHKALEDSDVSELNDDEQILAVEDCEKFQLEALQKFLRPDLAYDEYPSPAHPGELKLMVDSQRQSWGYLDKLYVQGDQALLIDYKAGYKRVDPAQTNLQGKGYTVGVFNAFPLVNTVFVRFIQPRINSVTDGLFHRSDLPALRAEIAELIDNAKNFHGELEKTHPGVLPCLYCGRRLSCPVMSGFMQLIVSKLEQLGVPTEFSIGSLRNNPEQLARLLNVKDLITKLVEDATDAAKELIASGQEVPGYELKERKGRTSVTDVAAAAEVCHKLGITDDDFIKAVTVSLTSLKEIAKSKAERGSKTAMEEILLTKLSNAGALSISDSTLTLKAVK